MSIGIVKISDQVRAELVKVAEILDQQGEISLADTVDTIIEASIPEQEEVEEPTSDTIAVNDIGVSLVEASDNLDALGLEEQADDIDDVIDQLAKEWQQNNEETEQDSEQE